MIFNNSPAILPGLFYFRATMPHFLLYNGSFYPNESPLIGADNRGLRYGDGLFETLRFLDAEIKLEEFHFERLFNGLQLLHFDLPARFTPNYLAEQIKALCRKNGHDKARVRINVFRGNGGLYDAENHHPNYIIQSWPLDQPFLQLNENGLVAGIYRDAVKSTDRFSSLKSNNFLPYTMAALQAKQEKWNEAFVLNNTGRICDATIANIFIVKNGLITTPALSEGCIAGVMRRHLLQELPNAGFSVQESTITEVDLMAADEVFLTNAIKGIRWVKTCGSSVFTNQLTQKLFSTLFKK